MSKPRDTTRLLLFVLLMLPITVFVGWLAISQHIFIGIMLEAMAAVLFYFSKPR
jgi:hypothetical protein